MRETQGNGGTLQPNDADALKDQTGLIGKVMAKTEDNLCRQALIAGEKECKGGRLSNRVQEPIHYPRHKTLNTPQQNCDQKCNLD